MKEINLLMMGLPDTGKTTFLIALWHTLLDYKLSSLKLKEITGNKSYLANLYDLWIKVEPLGRTQLASEQHSLGLDIEYDDNLISVEFPDLSGESFRRQWSDREINPIHHELEKKCKHLFLFIHPNKLFEPLMISDLDTDFRKSSVASSDDVVDNLESQPPAQIQLIDLLQFMKSIREDQPIDMTIIISAWDLVAKEFPNKTPFEWCNESLSILMQFIESNLQINLTEQFGVSAQGGDLKLDSKQLLEIDPTERILVVDQDGNAINDITIPLRKAISIGE